MSKKVMTIKLKAPKPKDPHLRDLVTDPQYRTRPMDKPSGYTRKVKHKKKGNYNDS